ncbi:MAG: AAA family ATPase [Actinobacteria bacterium]|nr:AAA family ATPase [Actinomycetota bacterium]
MSAPLIGRDVELDELLAAWREAADGTPRLAVIEGEPGIGKTHLAEALRAAVAREGFTVWGRCDEGGAAPSLWPWLAPLRALASGRELDPDLARVLSTEQVPADASTPASASRFALLAAMADLLERAAADVPVLVLIDDLQWADSTSLDLLAFLATAGRGRWMVLVTMRELEVGRNDHLVEALAAASRRIGTRRIHLRGLDDEGTAAMLAAATGIDRAAAHAIHRRADGNPFYAIELARLRDDGDQLVPAGVSDVVRRRLVRLPQATADLLSVAAVAGRDVDVPFLAHCAEIDLGAVLDHLDPAVAHRLLVIDPDRPSVLRFSHALVREVLLDGLTALRRARLHLRVAEAMEQGDGVGVDDVEIHAEHLWRAAPAGAGRRAAEALERAADVAVRRVSYTSAEHHLRRAVQLRRSSGRTDADLRAQLRSVEKLLGVIVATRYYQGADDGLVVFAQQLARRLAEHDLLAQLLWYEASAMLTSARRHDALPVVAELVELTHADARPEIRAMGLEKTAISLWSAGAITEAVVEIDRAAALYDHVPTGHDPVLENRRGECSMFWLMLHALHGDVPIDDVVRRFDAAIAAAPDQATASAICGFAATTASLVGRWGDVERFAAMATSDDRADQFGAGQLQMLRGVCDAQRGACEHAVDQFRAGRHRFTSVRARSSIVSAQANLAIHLARHGEVDDAAAMTAEARRELEEYDERWNEPTLLAADAVVLAGRSDAAAASALLASAVTLAHEQGSHALAAHLAGLAAELVVPGA